MGCCGCLGFLRKSKRVGRSDCATTSGCSHECLLPDNLYDANGSFFNCKINVHQEHNDESHLRRKAFEKRLLLQIRNGQICRKTPVRETEKVIYSKDDNGNKMVNEYVREGKIGSGSYGKVVLYRSTRDGKCYAVKVFHKSHLLKLRVAPKETAMTDVLREVLIMKTLDHPNIVNLIEVIDDPETDHFYMVMEYVDGKCIPVGSGSSGGLHEDTARRYLRDIVAGLMYLHKHNIVHGDIKPDNLLITSGGNIKIGDFSVSQVFEDNNDELRRSPGTPVFTAPECCLGLTYGGRAADTWAVGITLYCMVVGQYPFLGETLQDTYDKIVKNPILIPTTISPQLKSLLKGLLCKDPMQRMNLSAVAVHPWVAGEEGPVPEFLCHCKQRRLHVEEFGNALLL